MSHKSRKVRKDPSNQLMYSDITAISSAYLEEERARHSGPRIKARYQANLNYIRPLIPFIVPTDQNAITEMTIQIQDSMDRYGATYLIPKVIKNLAMTQILMDYPDAWVVKDEEISMPLLNSNHTFLMVVTSKKAK